MLSTRFITCIKLKNKGEKIREIVVENTQAEAELEQAQDKL